MLSTIGLLVIFATFIVKDILLERVKDSIASVDSAQLLFEVKQEIGVLREGINRLSLQSRFGVGGAKQDTQDINQLLKIGYSKRVESIDQTTELESFETEVEEFARKAQYETYFDKQIQEPNERLSDIQTETRAIDDEVQTIMHSRSTPRERAGRLRLVLAREDAQLDNLDKINEDFAVAYAMVLARIISESDRHEMQYRGYTHLSWVLYMFGWLLTFTGVICGVKGVDGAD